MHRQYYQLYNWNLTWTNIFIGFLVIIYTVSGGTKAVTQTQKQQMAVMIGDDTEPFGNKYASKNISFIDALHVAGKMGKLNLVNFDFSLDDRYNFGRGQLLHYFYFFLILGLINPKSNVFKW